jgi:hypothetical protein
MLDQQITDYEPARVVRVKKMTWSDQDLSFRTCYFHRIHCSTIYDRAETMTWLQEQFGEPCYQTTWWLDSAQSDHIWCTDHVAKSCSTRG